MNPYHKIDSVFKRDPENRHKTFLMGQYARPEFEYLKDCTWLWDEKVDGTNIRVIWGGETVEYRGRTDRAEIPAPLLEMLTRFLPAGKFRSQPITLYGEGYGPKIQKGGGNYREDQSFVLFDALVGDYWLKKEAVMGIAHELGLDVVPEVGRGTLAEAIEFVKAGFTSTWGDFMAEGIVLRPEVQLFNRQGSRVITKLKHKDFR